MATSRPATSQLIKLLKLYDSTLFFFCRVADVTRFVDEIIINVRPVTCGQGAGEPSARFDALHWYRH